MSNSFMRVDDVAQELGVSKSYAYKVVRKLNAELKEMGYLTVAGRISKQYFLEKYATVKKKGRDNNGSLQRIWHKHMARYLSLYRLDGRTKADQ